MTQSKVVFVTGVAGFLGKHIASEFYIRKWRVIGADMQPREFTSEFLGDRYYPISIANDELVGVLRSEAPFACIHCAGSASVPHSVADPLNDFDSNVAVTARLLESIRRHAPHCAVILLSSAAVYGSPSALPIDETTERSPISPYGYHKAMAEQLCAEYASLHGLRTASVRIFSAYGQGLRRQVLWDLCKRMLDGGPLVLQGTGDESRDFIHARDIAKGVSVVLDHGLLHGESYNLASGTETSISDLAKRLMEAMGLARTVVFDGLRPVGVPTRWRANIKRIMDLGFTPEVSLDVGVPEFARWARGDLSDR